MRSPGWPALKSGSVPKATGHHDPARRASRPHHLLHPNPFPRSRQSVRAWTENSAPYRGEAIVVGAAIGAVLGLGIGASDAIEEHDKDISDFLREKGYELVDDVTISQAIEEIASDVGRVVKGGFEVTAEAITESVEYTTEQLEALHRFLGNDAGCG